MLLMMMLLLHLSAYILFNFEWVSWALLRSLLFSLQSLQIWCSLVLPFLFLFSLLFFHFIYFYVVVVAVALFSLFLSFSIVFMVSFEYEKHPQTLCRQLIPIEVLCLCTFWVYKGIQKIYTKHIHNPYVYLTWCSSTSKMHATFRSHFTAGV